ncbi:serine O-acetyltransferase [Methylocaldum szegediense]|uniref:serine O-acetyltransferase n=2 Tax=Methylocaldum szegediense TaxID=73780 RepID=A0ABM9I8Q9_9GAMM|nr:serine O-acetyltransferase [Methylocaldum szegediense]
MKDQVPHVTSGRNADSPQKSGGGKMTRRLPSLFAEWREDVNCVFDRDPAARTRFEVLTTYPGLHAILIHRISHRLWRRGFFYAARFLAFLVRLWTNIDIHPGATIGRRFFIDHGAGVVIGETAEIGDDVTLYHGVTLGGTSWNKGKRHPTLGDGVLVGAGAKILGPITLGDNVRVGANSVVVKDVPANRTVVGIPGRIVQSRDRATVNPKRPDLDHNNIPDVVNQTISEMMTRIESLEKLVAAMRRPENDSRYIVRTVGNMRGQRI